MLHLLTLAALAWTSASTTATLGPLTIEGRDSRAAHTHGGAPARLGTAQFSLSLAGAQPVSLKVSGVEYLTGHDCEAPPETVRSRPAPGGIFPTNGSLPESVPTLGLVPGQTEVLVGFEAVDAVYTHCDRFAFRVQFEVEGADAERWVGTVVAETNVMRRTPARRH